MSLAEFSVKNRTTTYFGIFLFTLAGVLSYFQLGQLEDPEFTVKTGVVTTFYPGASPAEVELEVTDVIERAMQEIPEVDKQKSISRAGVSIVKVYIDESHKKHEMPQLWDMVRKKVNNVTGDLPPGTSTPLVSDDFSEVYGFVLAVTGDGFDLLELDDYADILKKELSLVPGVARCELWGEPERVVYIDISSARLSEFGLTEATVIAQLQNQNFVVNAGGIDVQERRLRVSPTGQFSEPEDIGNLVIRPGFTELILDFSQGANVTANTSPLPSASSDFREYGSDLIRLRDVVDDITVDYRRPPFSWMRYNGHEPAIALQISPRAGSNVVTVGKAIDARVAELLETLPVGIEVGKVAWQGDLVQAATDGFMVNLMQAVGIVLVVLWLTMGWRMAVIIGIGGLVLTILCSFTVMMVWGIDLQRMSLGALIIAMGMMVDNAIVVADGIVVRMQRGEDRVKAAVGAASQPSIPLLGATVIAVMAFFPIYAAPSDVGEYCKSLFQVVAVALILSWVLAMTIVPLMCIGMLPTPKTTSADSNPFDTKFYRGFALLLRQSIRFKWIFMTAMVALLVVSMAGFGYVRQMFFPDSSRPQLMVQYWAPQGTRVEQTIESLNKLEAKCLESDLVTAVASFSGTGPPRFYLPMDPELPYPEYGELLLSFDDYKEGFEFAAGLEDWIEENFADGLVRVRKFGVGPMDTWKFEALFSGPADADLGVLRDLANQGMEILHASPLTREVRSNMRQRTPMITPVFANERARWAGIDRTAVGRATQRAFDGQLIGLYRQRQDLYPILVRHTEGERRQAAGTLETLPVVRELSTRTVPLAQVTHGVEMRWEDPIIRRWDRRRSVRVQCSPIDGVTLPTLLDSVRDQFEAIELPPGYDLRWMGEDDSTAVGRDSLIPGTIPAVIIIAFTVVALFNAFRPAMVIFLTIPFAIIGVTAGFLALNGAFGFLALLGLMSLAGMMIKNAIVLLDEVKINLAAGKTPYQSVVDSALSRLRPVFNAAATTVLGVVPLLQDPFWVAMAITIMCGLAFGTLLTMFVIPVLYSCFYGIKPDPA